MKLTSPRDLTYCEITGLHLTIIDRYIIKNFLGFFLGALLVVITLFVAVDAMSNLNNLNPPVSSMISYYLYSLPGLIYQMAPVAGLIATVFTLSNMNRANELVALFSAGTSLARVAAPILVMVSALSTLLFFVGDRVIPNFNSKKAYVYYVEIKKQPGQFQAVRTNRIWYKSKNVIFNLQTLNPEKRRAQGVTFYYFDDQWKLSQLIAAKELEINGPKWDLLSGTITLFSEDSSFPLTQSFNKKTISLDEEIFDLTDTSSSAPMMSLGDLKKFIKKNKEAGLDTLHYEMDYHSKFSFAFAGFVMAFLGVPFSVSHNRAGGKMKNLGKCLLLVALYWTLYSSSMALGKHGVVFPVLAAWVPNVFMLVLTMGFLVRVKH